MNLEDVIRTAASKVIKSMSVEELYELATSIYQEIRKREESVIYFFKSKWLWEPGHLKFGVYPNGSTAIRLMNPDGELLATATVALSNLPEPGNVFIKNYSENEGIMPNLVAHGIIDPPIRTHAAGHEEVHECKLLIGLNP